MRENKPPKKHHFIPKFYLQSFALKSKKKHIINVFDKQTLGVFLQSIDNIGYVKDFHTVQLNGNDTDVFEKLHNEIYEKRFSVEYRTILNKLEKIRQDIKVCNCLSNKRCLEIYSQERFTEEEKIFFSFLLAYFIVRGKKWREFGEKIQEKRKLIMKDFFRAYQVPNSEEKIREEIGDKNRIKMSQLRATFEGDEIATLANYLYKHIWNIGFNFTENLFYTSDTAHALATMSNEQPVWMGIGYISPGNVIIFPISPRICIIMYDYPFLQTEGIKVIDNNYVILDEQRIKIINKQIILSSLEQIYSIDGNWKDLDECYLTYNIRKGHKPYGIY